MISDLEKKVRKLDIRQLIKDHLNIELEPVGKKGQLKCLCPIHNDTKPSLYIRSNNTFNCFGCKEKKFGGNVVDFIKRLKNFETREDAVLYLSEKYNIK